MTAKTSATRLLISAMLGLFIVFFFASNASANNSTPTTFSRQINIPNAATNRTSNNEDSIFNSIGREDRQSRRNRQRKRDADKSNAFDKEEIRTQSGIEKPATKGHRQSAQGNKKKRARQAQNATSQSGNGVND